MELNPEAKCIPIQSRHWFFPLFLPTIKIFRGKFTEIFQMVDLKVKFLVGAFRMKEPDYYSHMFLVGAF